MEKSLHKLHMSQVSHSSSLKCYSNLLDPSLRRVYLMCFRVALTLDSLMAPLSLFISLSVSSCCALTNGQMASHCLLSQGTMPYRP